MRRVALHLAIMLILLSSGAQALKLYSGETVSIDRPVDDDVFAAGSVVNVNAPVESAVVAGGTINFNAPVLGDLFVAGGQVLVSSDVGGKVVAAGGTLNLLGNVSRNLVMAGGQVNVHKDSFIGRDALIAAGDVYNAGNVNGTLTVTSSTFQNNGTAGKVDYTKVERAPEEQKERQIVSVFGLLVALGFLIAGLILLRFFPGLFETMAAEMRSSTAVKALVGFLAIIVSLVLILLLMVTVVGIPVALILMIAFAGAVMLSGLFVSFCTGQFVFSKVKPEANRMGVFVVGFVILNLLFLIPFLGPLVQLVSTSLGFGVILYGLRQAAAG